MREYVVKPDSAYLTLRCTPRPDAVTWQLLIARALTRFGGVHAAAVPVRLVAVREDTAHADAVVKCPHADAEVVAGAVGGATHEQFSVCVLARSDYMPFLV